MNINQVMFLIAFLSIMALLVLKLWNILRMGTFYNPVWIAVTFAGYLIAWFIILVSLLIEPTNDLYRIIFTMSSILMIVALLFSVVEFLFKFTELGDMVGEITGFDPKKLTPKA